VQLQNFFYKAPVITENICTSKQSHFNVFTADNIPISWEGARTPCVQSGLLMASDQLVSFCAPALAATGAGGLWEDFKSSNQADRNRIVGRKQSPQVRPPRTKTTLSLGVQLQTFFLPGPCNCRIKVYTIALMINRINRLQGFRFRGGAAFHVALGHDPSAESGLSLANGKRAGFRSFLHDLSSNRRGLPARESKPVQLR